MKKNVSLVCVCSAPNILISGKIIKEMPGFLVSGTHCTSRLFPSGYLTEVLHTFLFFLIGVTYPTHLSFFDLITLPSASIAIHHSLIIPSFDTELLITFLNKSLTNEH
jgi:hypothetical protein